MAHDPMVSAAGAMLARRPWDADSVILSSRVQLGGSSVTGPSVSEGGGGNGQRNGVGRSASRPVETAPVPFERVDREIEVGGSAVAGADTAAAPSSGTGDAPASAADRLLGQPGGSTLDERAFAEFYRELKPALVRYAARLRSDDPEGSADLAMFDLHRALQRGTFETIPALRAYAYRSVRSRVAGEFRRTVPVPVPFDEDDLANETSNDEGQLVVDRDAADLLLAGLNDAQRQVVEARYLDDLTAEEVGKRTDRSPEAVYQLQRRGLDNLRRVAPTILLVVLVVGGLVLLLLSRQSSTVTTDPIEPSPEVPDVPIDVEESSDVGQSGIGVMTDDGLVVIETGPGRPREADEGVAGTDVGGSTSQPESAFGSDPTTTSGLDDGGTASITTEVASPSTTTPASSTTVVPSSTTVAPSSSTTLAPFDFLVDPRQVARLRFEHSGLCLDVPGDSVGSVVVQHPCQAGSTQEIEIIPRRGGNAARAVHSSLCLGPQGNALVEGAVIVQQECTGQPWQVFEIPGGALTFWDEDLCYAVENDSTAEGARVVLARCTEGPTQRFSGA